jgi:urea carboxylase
VWRDRDDPPWLLRHFDQLRFERVEEDELEALREASLAGAWSPATEPVTFRLAEHDRLVEAHRDEIAAFRARREAAFAAERAAWAAAV